METKILSLLLKCSRLKVIEIDTRTVHVSGTYSGSYIKSNSMTKLEEFSLLLIIEKTSSNLLSDLNGHNIKPSFETTCFVNGAKAYGGVEVDLEDLRECFRKVVSAINEKETEERETAYNIINNLK